MTKHWTNDSRLVVLGGRAVALAVVAGIAAGCNPCASYCRHLAQVYDRCLDAWALSWEEVGAEDFDSFQEQCADAFVDYAVDSSDDVATEFCRAADDALPEGISCVWNEDATP